MVFKTLIFTLCSGTDKEGKGWLQSPLIYVYEENSITRIQG
jgi:hypothetical protein